MKRPQVFSLFLVTFLILAGAVIAGSGRRDDATPVAPPIGTIIEDFTLLGTDGAEHSLKSLEGKSGAVLIFISVQCPVSNGYNARMEKLANDYKARGIAVIGINANNTESAEAVKQHAADKGLTFPILKDKGNKIADRLGAVRTPEAYLLDSSNRLVFHGPIDNSQNEAKVESNYLRDAMDAVLAGKPVPKTTALAFGCSIKRA